MLISFVSEKGGVGKTTLASVLAERLVHLGHKVELADGDPQGSLKACAESSKGKLPKPESVFPRDYEALREREGLVFLDLPSGIREEFYTALAVSDGLIVPCSPSAHDLRVLPKTLGCINQAIQLRDVPPKVLVLPVKINRREKASKELLSTIKKLPWPTTRSYLAERSAYRRSGNGGLLSLPSSSRRLAWNEVSDLAEEVLGFFGFKRVEEKAA